MTFVISADASLPAVRLFNPALTRRLPAARIRASDEDSARRALGSDFVIPASLASGVTLENLARIALG